jgi:hypothetical protein
MSRHPYRRQLLGAAGLVGLLIVFWVLHNLRAIPFQEPSKPLGPGPTRENFRRLYKGMSEDEAFAILGKPDRQRYFSSFSVHVYYGDDGSSVVLESTSRVSPGSVLENGKFQRDGVTVMELCDPDKIRSSRSRTPFEAFYDGVCRWLPLSRESPRE